MVGRNRCVKERERELYESDNGPTSQPEPRKCFMKETAVEHGLKGHQETCPIAEEEAHCRERKAPRSLKELRAVKCRELPQA